MNLSVENLLENDQLKHVYRQFAKTPSTYKIFLGDFEDGKLSMRPFFFVKKIFIEQQKTTFKRNL